MKVKVWDGTELPAKDRDEAVKIVKRELKGWMQKGDRLTWSHARVPETELPDYATVVNEVGEYTDASAIILS